MKLRLAYFGSPDFSAHVLERIINEIPEVSVELVVTQPDRPVGRKHILTPTPVKLLAQENNILVSDSAQMSDFHFSGSSDSLSERGPVKVNNLTSSTISECDLALVFAYGEIIPDEILKLPKYGFWNIHPSLLPQFRGPSPLVFPILLGYPETGVTLMQMDAQMDHGPIIAQQKLPIDPEITHDLLLTHSSDVGFELFKKIVMSGELPACRQAGRVSSKQQKHSEATFTKLLKREDGFIPYQVLEKAKKNSPITMEELPYLWKSFIKKNQNSSIAPDIQNSGKLIYNYFRALHPWPGMWTIKDEKRMKIIEACFETNNFVIKKLKIEGEKESAY